MNESGGMQVQFQVFSSLVVDGRERSPVRPNGFIPRETASGMH
jgi:hypothetical protein